MRKILQGEVESKGGLSQIIREGEFMKNIRLLKGAEPPINLLCKNNKTLLESDCKNLQ